MLLLSALAFADSFLTSVAFPVAEGVVPALPGPCGAEVARLATSGDAFEHAMVLGACHGYDSNPALVSHVRNASGPYHSLDLAWTLMYAATYGSPDGAEGVAAARAALKEHPVDPRVPLVAALVLAQHALFVKGGNWEARTKHTREIVGLVRTASTLNRSHPVPRFDEAMNAAVDYLGMYGVFAELASERVDK